MRRYIISLFLLSFLLVFPLEINALICDHTELSRYKNIANNVDMFYYFDEYNEPYAFNIIFNNLREGILIRDYTNNRVYDYSSSNKFISGFKDGQRHKFDLFVEDTFCQNNVLITLHADLPKYNPFYKEPTCDLSISICDKWSNHNLDRESFLKRVEELKKQEEIIEKPIEDDKYYSLFLELYEKYYLYFYLVIISSASLAIYYLNKKDDFDLETN